MTETLADRIQQRLDALGKSAQGASLEATGKKDTIRMIQTGRSREPRIDTVKALARVLQTSAAWLLGETENDTPETARIATESSIETKALPVPSTFSMPKDLPVHGTASGSVFGAKSGAWQMTSDPVEYIRRPPGLATVRDAYALYVENESMVPAYRPGDLVVVHPHRVPRPGDPVIVQTQNGEHADIETYIKFLVRRANGDVICRQLNPESEVTFRQPTVLLVHRVLTMAEVIGV